ncbi:MAG TPA: hypothetical protein VJR02_05590 [Pyrinomonadaceae bacterium]|nr:hypothetical protein [Pyrinomonadaceae bacterium]
MDYFTHQQYIDFVKRFPDPDLATFFNSPANSDVRLRIVTELPGLPSESFYGDIKVKPLRLRPSLANDDLSSSGAPANYASGNFLGGYCPLAISSNNHLLKSTLGALRDLPDWLPRIPGSLDRRIVLQLPSDAPNILTPVQQVVAILVGIFTSFFAALNTLFAWQVYRRRKAQEILIQLQIAKLHAERAEREAKERNDETAPRIILIS